MDDRDCTDLDSFISTARGHGIGTVIIAWQDEHGQREGHETVVYERLQRLSLLAYHRADACILRYQTDGGADLRRQLRAQLEDAGFTVAERSRNEVSLHDQDTPPGRSRR